MPKRLLATLVFAVLMTFSIVGSLVVVVCFYVPLVVIKAVAQMMRGRAKLRAIAANER